MYYHLLIKITDKAGKSKVITEIDKTIKDLIIEDVIIPYQNDEQFIVNGCVLEKKDIKRFKVLYTEKSARELSNIENYNMPPNVVMYVSPQDILHYNNYTTDITQEILEEATQYMANRPKKEKNISKLKIMLVHGQDNEAKEAISHFIKKLGYEVCTLHDQEENGMTTIEKLEQEQNVGFAIVLYTPCEVGYLKNQSDSAASRARQNVVFEHGYLIAKLGVNNVSALVYGDVEIPNDITGVVYIQMEQTNGWKIPLAKEMKSSGLEIDYNLVM